MRLSFDYSYADYNDTQNWLPVFEELKAIYADLQTANAASFSDDKLLESLEKLEELMRYYTATINFHELEGVVRLFHNFLEIGKSRGIDHVAFQYFNMEFLRINGLLYENAKQPRKACDYYHTAVQTAEKCFKALAYSSLSTEQMLFIGWACSEVFQEAIRVHDRLMNQEQVLLLTDKHLHLMEALSPTLGENYGLREKLANIYASYGGVLYQSQQPHLGKKAFVAALDAFSSLYHDTDSQFYMTMGIWIKCLYSIQAFHTGGDATLLLECEQEADRAQQYYALDPHNQAILEGTQGLLLSQKGILFQMNNNIPGALTHTGTAVTKLKKALSKLEKEADALPNLNPAKSMLTDICARIFNCMLGTQDSLGVQQYFSENYSAAKETFNELLTAMTGITRYNASELANTIIRAEALHYLSLIATNEGNVTEIQFYGSQASSLAWDAAQRTNNLSALTLTINSSATMAETTLFLKDKPKALEYCQICLDACTLLKQADPTNELLNLIPIVEKLKKKASRRFF